MSSTESATSSSASSPRGPVGGDALASLGAHYEQIANSDDGRKTFDSNAAFSLARTISCDKNFPQDIARVMTSVVGELSTMPFADIGAYLKHLASCLFDKAKELGDLAVQHRKVIAHAGLIIGTILLAFALPHLVVKLIHVVGFEAQGILAGSAAAAFQSAHMGGQIAQGSVFAALQSIGALGQLPAVAEAIAVTSGIAAGAAAWFHTLF